MRQPGALLLCGLKINLILFVSVFFFFCSVGGRRAESITDPNDFSDCFLVF